MKYVLDSNVALKWVLPEADSDKAIKIRDEFGQGIHQLLSPDVFPIVRVSMNRSSGYDDKRNTGDSLCDEECPGVAGTMNIPVLIEPIANNGFRATGGLPFEITVEGATRDEALGRLRAEIDKRMARGAIVVPLEITPTEDHPWIQGAGMFRDNPLFDKWQEAISEYRRQVDQDAEAP